MTAPAFQLRSTWPKGSLPYSNARNLTLVGDQNQNSTNEKLEKARTLKNLLAHRISTLSDETQKVLNLYFCSGMNIETISEQMGIPEIRTCQLLDDGLKNMNSLKESHGVDHG